MNKNALDSGLEDETDALAGQSVSSEGGKQSLGTDTSLLARLDKLEKELEATRRTAQGDKDRAVRKLSDQLESYKPVLERVKKLTKMSDEDAANLERELEYDELKRRVFGGESTQTNAPTPPAKSVSAQADVITDVVNGLDLSLTDPEVAAVVAKGESVGKIAKALVDLMEVRKSKPLPNPAAAAMPSGEGTPAGKQLSDAEVNAKVNKLRDLYKRPTFFRDQIVQLEKELSAYGF